LCTTPLDCATLDGNMSSNFERLRKSSGVTRGVKTVERQLSDAERARDSYRVCVILAVEALNKIVGMGHDLHPDERPLCHACIAEKALARIKRS